jgi:sec-independent protein translocase protein TatA
VSQIGSYADFEESHRTKEGGLMLAEIIGPDILIVVAILVVLFGGSQLPKLARNLGQAQKELRKGFAEGQQEAESAATSTTPTPAEASLSSTGNVAPPSETRPVPAELPDTATLTRAELERLVDQRVRAAMDANDHGAEEPDQSG